MSFTRPLQTLALVLCALLAAAPLLAAELSVAQMRGQRRVLIISAPSATDSQYEAQLSALQGWHGGDDRDLTLVRIAGALATGSHDSADALRGRYQLPADRFFAVLIGKDGHVALRADTPMSTEKLETVIDAMPMRRAGQR